MIEGLVGLAAMMVIAFLRVPIAYAMGIVGIVGYAYMRDWNWLVASAMVQTKIYETGRNYTLSVVPLFILMGNFVTRAGMSEELFRAAYTFIGHLRGGLAMATVWASAGFGGICGSSIATTATMAKVAYPSMKRFGYADQLAAGTVAGAGTLGIMIPPSTIMVIYGVFTETNIGKLFMAGILPGMLGAILLCLAIVYTTWRHPTWGPRGPRSSWAERGSALKDVWAVAVLFLFVMGGIYGGLFTATEGAGMGAMGALGFALSRRALTWRTFYDALLESARTTAMLFVILIGALMFAEFVNITTMPKDLTGFVSRFAVHPDHGRGSDLRHLRGPRHRHGGAVDGAPHHARLLPGDRAPRLRPRLVRYHHRLRRRDRPDQPARRDEHVRAEDAPAPRLDRHRVPRRDAVRLRRHRSASPSSSRFRSSRSGCRA